MWNIAAQAGTGMAIAGLSATYYALIRKNVEMENRAMDDLAAEMLKEGKKAGIDGRENVGGSRSEYRMPTTASQNLLRKNFQLIGKESGRIFGINVAHSNALLVERNHSESDIDHVVNRTETFASKSAVALAGAKKSKSDFDVFNKFRYRKSKGNSSALERSSSGFDVDTFAFLESSVDSLSQDPSKPIKICHCKYSASAEDIYISPSRNEIQSENCKKNEEPPSDVLKAKSPAICGKSSTRKQLQGSLLSDDYVPRLENREFGAYNLPVPKSSSKRSYPSHDKDAHSTHVIFLPGNSKQNISKIPRLLKKGVSNSSNAEDMDGKSLLETTQNVYHENAQNVYPENTQNDHEANDDEFPPTENLLSLKIESELGGALRDVDETVRFSTSDLKRSKQDSYLISSEHPSSSMFSLPDLNAFSITVAQEQQQQLPVNIKDNNNHVLIETLRNNHSPCLLELSTANSWQMVCSNVKTSTIILFRAFIFVTQSVLNIPIGVVAFIGFAFIACGIFIQIVIKAGIFQEVDTNPADAAIDDIERTML